jgi:hypothetical protein
MRGNESFPESWHSETKKELSLHFTKDTVEEILNLESFSQATMEQILSRCK